MVLSASGRPSVPAADAKTLAFLRESGVTVALDETQLRELQLAMDAAMAAGDDAVKRLRAIIGPEAAGIAEQIVRMLLMGSGYFRAARDTIHALFHARGKVRRAKKKGARSC
jgi:hypothetical protein